MVTDSSEVRSEKRKSVLRQVARAAKNDLELLGADGNCASSLD